VTAAAEAEEAFRSALTRLPEVHASLPHDDLIRLLADRYYVGALSRIQLANYLAVAVVALLDEQAVVEKTLENWDVMSEARAEREAERYRLAWLSARERARETLQTLRVAEADLRVLTSTSEALAVEVADTRGLVR